MEQAAAYLSLCQQDYQEDTLRKAASAGSALMLSARSFGGAVEALREARLQEKGNLLQAVCDGKIRGLTALHEAYLKEMALEGILVGAATNLHAPRRRIMVRCMGMKRS